MSWLIIKTQGFCICDHTVVILYHLSHELATHAEKFSNQYATNDQNKQVYKQ